MTTNAAAPSGRAGVRRGHGLGFAALFFLVQAIGLCLLAAPAISRLQPVAAVTAAWLLGLYCLGRQPVKAALACAVAAWGPVLAYVFWESRPAIPRAADMTLVASTFSYLPFVLVAMLFRRRPDLPAPDATSNADPEMARLAQLADAAETADRQMTGFFAEANHAIRTLLNAIIGYSEMVQEEGGGGFDEQQLADVGRIHEACQRLLGLLGRAFDLSEIEAAPSQSAAENAAPAAVLKKRQEAAVRAQKAKCEFLAGMGHDLRTPLNAIIGYSEMLLEDLDASGGASAELSRVHDLAQILLSHTDAVLDLAKSELGRLPVFVESTTLEELVAELGQECGRDAPVFDLGAELPARVVKIDVRKFRQVFRHVFRAATDLMGSGRLEVRIACSGRRLACTITARGESGRLATLKSAFEGRCPAEEFSGVWRNARFEMALGRRLVTVLEGHASLMEEAGKTSLAFVIPLHAGSTASGGEAALQSHTGRN